MNVRSPPERRGVSSRHARTIAWVLFGLTVVLFVPGVILAATQTLWDFELSNLIWALSILAFGAVGALIASRRPDNLIGWLLTGGALLVSTGLMGVEYATRAVMAQSGSWPGHQLAAWTGLVLVLAGFTLLLPATALHFPDGRLPSPGWRWVRRLLAAGVALALVISAFAPGTLMVGRLQLVGDTLNPFGVDIPLLETLRSYALPLLFGVFVVGFAAPYVRLRRARGVERQQLKWFVYATVLMALAQLTIAALSALRPGEEAGDVAVNSLTALGFMAIPVAIGIAVLRHRLYDIDVVIHRTLVYGILTVLLAGVYAAGVVGLPLLLSFNEGSELLVAGSTLAVVAMFSPLRRRVQELVDRRFYRTRYDARETVNEFSARLNRHTEVDQLKEDLKSVVNRSLQPASMGVWLRTPSADRDDEED